MSRPTINVLSSLRPTTILRSLPSAAVQPVASSSTSHFSTSSPNHASRSKQVAKRKKSQVLALRASRQAEDAHPPDPILGHIPTDSSTGRSSASAASIDGHGGVTSASASAGGRSRNTWEGCRLQRTILTPTDVWSAPYNTTPQHYLPGLSAEDRDLLFGAVPHTTLTLGTRDVSDEARSMRGTEEQERQTGAMMKILDLRNSSKKGIEVVNRQRIIEEFGRTRVMGEDGQVRFEGEPQSGGSEVQGQSSSSFTCRIPLICSWSH